MRGRASVAVLLMYLAAGSAGAAEDGSAKTATPADSAATTERPASQTLLTQRFDDWAYRCAKTKNSAEVANCELFQAIAVEQDGKRTEVLKLAVSRTSGKGQKIKWALVVLAPLDIHLPSNFGLQVGRRKPVQARYRNCNHLGCWAIFPAASSMIDGLKKSKDGAGLFRLLNGKVVKVVFSLKGFTMAFNAMNSGSVPVVSSVEQSRLKR